MIAQVLQKGASIHVVTGKPVDASIESQCMVFAIGIAAQIERDLISERTKSALKARKAEGVKLGRPEGKGRKVDEALQVKGLTADYLIDMAKAGLSVAKIARLIDLDQRTVGAWLKAQNNTLKAPEREAKMKTLVIDNPPKANDGSKPKPHTYSDAVSIMNAFNSRHRGLKSEIIEIAYSEYFAVAVFDTNHAVEGVWEYL
jgi:DNA-binding transcriptional ArsR family regulator